MKRSSIISVGVYVLGVVLFISWFLWMMNAKQNREEQRELQQRNDAVLEYVCDQKNGTMLYIPEGAQCWTNRITLP